MRLPPREHTAQCASTCTNYNNFTGANGDMPGARCDIEHSCWCPDGGLSYADYQKAHPEQPEDQSQGVQP